MKRLLPSLSVIGPTGLLLLLWLQPELDKPFAAPLFHFYLVTFFTFTSLVVASFTAVALGRKSASRHHLLATCFAVMGALFLVHGVTTPEAIIFTSNPGIRWGAWLTLSVGATIFTLAAFDTPQRPLPLKKIRLLYGFLALFCLTFILIVIFAPQWLAFVDSQAGPWPQQIIAIMTLLLWLWSALRFWQIWRITKLPIDGTMALIAAWLTIATISMHGFTLWHLSWWLYHIELLLGAVTAVTVLIIQYKQLQLFRLTHYYAAIGLILTAALALTASHFFSRTVERGLVNELTDQSERVGENLAFTLVCDLPANLTRAEFRELAQDGTIFQTTDWPTRLTGLEIGVMAIFDANQTPLYQTPAEAYIPSAPQNLQTALTGQTTSYIFSSSEPVFAATTSTRYLQTFIPIRLNEQIIGILSTVQAVPGLLTAVIQARLHGLLIAALSVGLLYAIMLFVVYRAEQFIIARNNELAEAYGNLQMAEAMRDDLTDMIVHDLRSPLTSINLSVDLLEKILKAHSTTKEHTQLLERTKGAAQRMMNLIDQLLDVARLETGRLQLARESVAIEPFLQEKVQLFTPQLTADQKQMRIEVSPNCPPLTVDKELIGRVLDNLISNAIKYTDSKGQITLRATANGQNMLLQVIDDGEGIDPTAAQHIFEKFYQIKNNNGKPLRTGTGLGLTFCKLVVEAHQGQIWVESNLGQGSVFSLNLPLL